MRVDIEDFKKKFNPMIYQTMTDTSAAGSSFTIFQDDIIIYSKGFGSRNLLSSLPFTPDTIGGFASIAKTFTALAILLLQEEGKLSIDDPISKYLPIIVGRENQSIKIKHLLSHSSGIPDLGHGHRTMAILDPESGNKIFPFSNWDEVYYHVNGANSEIFFNPGEHFYYFNTGFILLGHIIAQVSGLSYPEFIREKITSKIGLSRTRFLASTYNEDENITVNYVPKPNPEGNPSPKPFITKFDEFIFGAGALFSSTNEMAKFLITIANDGKFNGTQIFSKEIIQELTTSRVTSNIFTQLGDAKACYGCFRIENFLGTGDTLILNSGGHPGMHAEMAFLKNAKIGIIASSNCAPLPFMEYITAFCYLLGKKPEEEFSFIKKNRHLKKLAGTYVGYKGIGNLKLVVEGGKLLDDDSGHKTPFYHKSDALDEMEFYIPGSMFNMDVKFVTDEKNKVHCILDRWVYHKIS